MWGHSGPDSDKVKTYRSTSYIPSLVSSSTMSSSPEATLCDTRSVLSTEPASTIFFPTALIPGVDELALDIAIVAQDGVIFFSSQSVLRDRSCNLFGQMLPTPVYVAVPILLSTLPLISMGWETFQDDSADRWTSSGESGQSQPQLTSPLPTPHPFLTCDVTESSSVLDIILHIVYAMPLAHNGADLEVLSQALASLEKYGIAIPKETSDVWSLVLQHAPIHPVRAYAIAATYSIDSCCVATSRYTLQVSLDALTEADALAIGSIYMRRLFLLHLGRREALKRVISQPPNQHAPLDSCSLTTQNEIGRSWAIAVANVLTRRMAHGTQFDILLEVLVPLVCETTCRWCQDNLRVRVSQVLREWLLVKRTI